MYLHKVWALFCRLMMMIWRVWALVCTVGHHGCVQIMVIRVFSFTLFFPGYCTTRMWREMYRKYILLSFHSIWPLYLIFHFLATIFNFSFFGHHGQDGHIKCPLWLQASGPWADLNYGNFYSPGTWSEFWPPRTRPKYGHPGFFGPLCFFIFSFFHCCFTIGVDHSWKIFLTPHKLL